MVSRVHGYTPQGRISSTTSIGKNKVLGKRGLNTNTQAGVKPYEKRVLTGKAHVPKPCVIGEGQKRVNAWTCRCVECILSRGNE